MEQIPLRCQCGAVAGVLLDVTPEDQKRAVCYCDDCQIYLLHLKRGDILDAQGGTEALMTTPAQVRITQGAEQVRGLRLSPKGLYRWYTACCNTPVGNMVKASLPVLILPLASVDFAVLGKTAEQAFGPPVVRMQARYAKGGVPSGAHAKTPLAMLPRFLRHLLSAALKRRGQPSPFFDARGQPKAPLNLIDKGERESLRGRVLEAAGLR